VVRWPVSPLFRGQLKCVAPGGAGGRARNREGGIEEQIRQKLLSMGRLKKVEGFGKSPAPAKGTRKRNKWGRSRRFPLRGQEEEAVGEKKPDWATS